MTKAEENKITDYLTTPYTSYGEDGLRPPCMHVLDTSYREATWRPREQKRIKGLLHSTGG